MRLSSIAALDLLSFTRLDLQVPGGLSVIVGPNGSGKTNLGRVARLAIEAVRATVRQDFAAFDQEWSLAGRYGSPRFEARLGLVFDRDDELAVIEDWAHAAVLSAFQPQNPQILAQLAELMPADLHARERGRAQSASATRCVIAAARSSAGSTPTRIRVGEPWPDLNYRSARGERSAR